MNTKAFLVVLLLLLTQIPILSNPIDNTPITLFSELVFDDNDNWTMELLFPFGYVESEFDSVIIKISDIRAKLIITVPLYYNIWVINSDSLSIPLKINREGDIIEIYTYSNVYIERIREDRLIFGNYPGATVGAPVSGYSICKIDWEIYDDNMNLECLTKNPSLGIINDTLGLSGILKGHIYDADNNLVTQLKKLPDQCYFLLHTALHIFSDGTYSTKIFRRFETEIVDYLMVRLSDFYGWKKTQEIELFELNDIHPDTIVFQDIYLKSNDYVVTDIEDVDLSQNYELTLINYPNPFNATTNFFVKIPDNIKKEKPEITIYNLSGEMIKNIPVQENIEMKWDGKDSKNKLMPSGIYYYRLNIGNQAIKSGSMILLK